MKRIDCSNRTCPQPVLETKAAMDGGEKEFLVIVDNSAALENVKRFAQSRNANVYVRDLGDKWELHIAGGGGSAVNEPARPACKIDTPTAFLFLSDRMGSNSELGAVLVRSLFSALTKANCPPARLIFMNEGVNLVCEGSPVLEELSALEALGATILACGTCLDFLHKKDRQRIGIVTNMYDSVETMTFGHRVVTIS